MSWSGSGTIKQVAGEQPEVNITASPQTNNDNAKAKSIKQIEQAKIAARQLIDSECYGPGEYSVNINGHAHSEGDAGDACGVSIYRKS